LLIEKCALRIVIADGLQASRAVPVDSRRPGMSRAGPSPNWVLKNGAENENFSGVLLKL
jgi:hypothetical protein